MILFFVLENFFKVIVNILFMDIVWVRFECNLVKEKGNMK